MQSFSSIAAKKSMYGNQGLSSLTTTINSSRVADYLENLVKQARMKYEAGAFLHWYWRHGASKVHINISYSSNDLALEATPITVWSCLGPWHILSCQ